MQINVKQTGENEKEDAKYQYEITYPQGNSKELNQAVTTYIQKRKQEFLNIACKREVQKEFLYTLSITYRTFQVEQFYSIIFEEENYTGGAHPEHLFKSFSWNLEEENFVTIKSLSSEYKNFMKKSSCEARKKLLYQNPELLQVKEMFLEGTRPFLFNFEVFAFTKKGFLYVFPPYQIAPYSMGSFEVTLPYQAIF